MNLLTVAVEIRDSILDHPDAPEGIEHFRWLWVPVSWRACRVPASSDFVSIAEHAPPPANLLRVVEIGPTLWAQFHLVGRAWVGWDRYERVAVLALGNGGELPRLGRSVDTDLRALADAGQRQRNAEAWKRLLELADELGLSDGEEWKRGRVNEP